MAQSSLTVTPPNPTPPTNMSFLGTTPPTAPGQPAVDDGTPGPGTAFAIALTSVDNTNFPSVQHEGRGTEVVVTQTYNPIVYNPAGPLVTVSTMGNYTWIPPTAQGNANTAPPNQQHASSLTPPGAPTITSLTPQNVTAGAGTQALAVNGTNFTRQSVVYVAGVAQVTSYVSSVQLNVNAAPKRATAGNSPVYVVTAGTVQTAPTNWVFV